VKLLENTPAFLIKSSNTRSPWGVENASL